MKEYLEKNAGRIATFYGKFGIVNGVGRTKIDNYGKVNTKGVDAISVYFEELNYGVNIMDFSPGEFEGHPIVAKLIGKIVLE